MPTIHDLLRDAESKLSSAKRSRTQIRTEVSSIVDAVEASGRANLTPAEGARVDELLAKRSTLTDEIEAAEAKIGEFRTIALEELENDRQARDIQPTTARKPSYDGVARVGQEERAYRADDERSGRPTFLRDLFASQIRRDPAAGERLARHGREVEVENTAFAQRAMTTGAVSGFVPPQYLVDLWAELARAGRPVANLCTPIPLPEVGMELKVPKITTGTAVAVQSAENAALTTQDLDDTLIGVPVNTVAGYVDLSRQAIERGVIVESLVMSDLAADYNAKLDVQVINGSGASGQHTGILGTSSITTITYTDATPTVPEMWPKLADAVRQVVSQRFTGPTAIVMTPLAWGWILAEKDTTGRPLVDLNGTGNNSVAVGSAPQYGGSAGVLFGIPVVLSGGVPSNLGAGTNETRIIVADFRDIVIAEDESAAPQQLRFDDVLSSTLGVRLLAYGYSAFTAARQPKAVSVVAGTGLILPSL